MLNDHDSYLTRDVFSKEERAVILWKMAGAIYDVRAKTLGITEPFGSLSLMEREMWVQCARAAIRAFAGLDPADERLPIERG